MNIVKLDPWNSKHSAGDGWNDLGCEAKALYCSQSTDDPGLGLDSHHDTQTAHHETMDQSIVIDWRIRCKRLGGSDSCFGEGSCFVDTENSYMLCHSS